MLRLLPPDAVTQHTIDTPSGKIDYTATAGTLSLFEQSGERIAAIFYTAYVAKGGDGGQRPVTFVFNGGPGAASAFLNIGLVGPRIVEFGDDGRDGAAPRLQDNPDTWLAFTDLVLIDPVGTGWSRPAKPDGGSAFWGVRRDAEIARQDDRALRRQERPHRRRRNIILGESYGGFRAAKVAQALQRDQGIAASGIVMVSPLIEGGADLRRHPLRARCGAATAVAGRRRARAQGHVLREKLAAAEHFALSDYLTTLAGPPPHGEAATRVLSALAADDRIAARSRSRSRAASSATPMSSTCAPPRARSSAATTRPSRSPIRIRSRRMRAVPIRCSMASRAPTAAPSSAYARDELGFKTEMTYVLLASDIAGKWDWGEGGRPRPRQRRRGHPRIDAVDRAVVPAADRARL